MMRQPSQLVTLLVLAGLGASFLLAPRDPELGLILYKAHRYQEAETVFTRLWEQGRMSRTVLSTWAQVHLAEGNIDSAISAYEQFMQRHPQDMEVLKHLVPIYRETLRPYDEMLALARLVQVDPSPDHWKRLSVLYHRFEREEEERKALEHLIALKTQDIEPYRHLVRLLAGSGALEDAALFSLRLAEGFPEQMDKNEAEFHLRLLLLSGHHDQALAWAQQRIAQEADAIRYAALIASNGRNSDLEALFRDIDPPDPELMPDWLIDRILSLAWQQERHDFLQEFLSRLSTEQQQRQPVLMSWLAWRENNLKRMAHWVTLANKVNDALPAWQLLALVSLHLNTGHTGSAMKGLEQLTDRTDLPVAPLVRIAADFISTPQRDQALTFFDSVVIHQPDSRLIYARTLLGASVGRSSQVNAWLEEAGGNTSLRLIEDLYFAAYDNDHLHTALNVSEWLFEQFGRPIDALRLAQTLMRLDQLTKAIAILEPLHDSDPHLERMWQQSLELAHRRGLPVRERMLALWEQELVSGQLDRDEKRTMAFRFLELQDKAHAVAVLRSLANDEGPDGENLQDLLFLWGPMPGNGALDWLEQRARQSPQTALTGWLGHLLDLGAAHRLISVASERLEKLDIDGLKLVIRAMDKTRNIELETHLAARANQIGNINSMSILAREAEKNGQDTLALRLWNHILISAPGNLDALRAIGLASFADGDLEQATAYLERAVQSGVRDWESHYYLAELLRGKGRLLQAQTQYRHALEILDKKRATNRQMQEARARSLYQVGRTDESLALFEKLQNQFSGDLTLRGEYATMLIEQGQLERARELLEVGP